MSEIVISDNIQDELEELANKQATMEKSKVALREFILSPNFLILPTMFHRLLSVWVDALQTLVEATGTPFVGSMKPIVPPKEKEMLTQIEGMDMTLAKAVVLAVAVIGSVALCVIMQAPWTIAGLVIGAVIVLTFFNQIAGQIREFMKKPEPEKVSQNPSINSISESISHIRSTYLSRQYLMKFQRVNPYKRRDPRVDPSLYDRRRQTIDFLRADFMSRIDNITVECNNAAFRRRMVLYSYWRASPPPAPQLIPQSTLPSPENGGF